MDETTHKKHSDKIHIKYVKVVWSGQTASSNCYHLQDGNDSNILKQILLIWMKLLLDVKTNEKYWIFNFFAKVS
jgi:hypothetical protein